MTAFRLVVEKGSSKGKHVRLKPNGSVVVGREHSNTLQISDPQTSRKHFQIEAKLGEYVLKDLNSSNGTYVNGDKVKQTVTLKTGDKIAVGDTLVYFLEETEEEVGNRRGQLTGRELAGYRIGRLLGRGGMGTVYEAVQISLERKVAFKVLSPEFTDNPEFVDRFISEARAAGRLNHANIVSVFDVGQQEGQYFYSMEYMAGGSVEDLLRQEKQLPAARTIPIVFDAARGLEYAEKQGLIHRDIKPDNLMLGADEVVKICDLGLAIFSSRQHDVSGSPHYIAPEQALGKDIDHRADLYALGVSWYHMLSGETPFSGRSAQEVARKHVEEQAPPLREKAPDVPEDVAALVERLMRKDPAERLPSARQLQADLAELARRYPVRETVLLRIDAVAPDQAPSAELLPAAQAVDEQGVLSTRNWISWVVVGLLAVSLLTGAFLITSKLMSGRARERESARQDVAKVRQLLETGEVLKAAADGKALADRLEQEGHTKLAEEAREIATRAEEAQEQAKLQRRGEEAAEKLKTARRLLTEHGTAADTDPAVRSRLEEVRRLLTEIVEEYPKTSAAQEAQEVRRTVNAQLERVVAAQRKVAQRQAAARRSLGRTSKRIKGLLASERVGRFRMARDAAKEYVARYQDVEARAGQALVKEVEDRARREVRQRTSQALLLMRQKEFRKAEAELGKVSWAKGKGGFPSLALEIARAERTLGDLVKQAADEKKAKRERDDREKLVKGLAKIGGYLKTRDYKNAASKLRSEVLYSPLYLKTPAVRRIAQLRLTRLRGAASALKRLADHVRAGKKGVELEVEFTGAGGMKRARAVRYDSISRAYTFRHPTKRRIMRDVKLKDIPVVQLLGMFKALDLEGRHQLQVACLAYELGQKLRAVQRLNKARGLDSSLSREIDDMMFLDAQGQ